MQSENLIGHPFFELSDVDSSNNYAMRQVQAQMAVHGATWFAHYQNAGKGQRGKAWNAEPGQNIMMSTVLEPGFLSIDNQFVLTITVALACFDFFNKYTFDSTSIKWPNDIYWKDRKAGGILIENLLQGKEWKYSVAGMGININQAFFPPALPNPVSLKQITGKTYHIIDLSKELCECMNCRWKQLASGKHDQLFEDYMTHLYKLGEKATFRKNNLLFDAVVAGISKKGELLLDSGKQEAYAFGSIEWVIAAQK